MQTRNEVIDVAKGIAIILMVIGHTDSPLGSFIYLFHMAFFFIISGYLFKERHCESCISLTVFIIKKIKTLWLPYFIWTMFFILLTNKFILINVYSNNPSLIETFKAPHIVLHQFISNAQMLSNIKMALNFGGLTEAGGALWFLPAMFYGVVFYCVVCFIFNRFIANIENRELLKIVLSIILLKIALSGLVDDDKLIKICISFSLFTLGSLIRYLNEFKIKTNLNKYICGGVKLFLPIAILFLAKKSGYIALDRNHIESINFFIMVSISGYFLVVNTSKLLFMTAIGKYIGIIGKHTIAIMSLHFLSFKVVSYFYVMYYGKPMYYIACFPTIPHTGKLWIAYVFFGVLIPVFLDLLYKKIIVVIKEKTNYKIKYSVNEADKIINLYFVKENN